MLCYYWGSTVKSFTPSTLLKFFCRLVEDMDRSPMKNNPRPTLRGTSTYLRGSPGVERVRERSPLPPLIILHRHLFALAWANARATGMQGKGIGNLSLERKLLIVFTPLPPQGGEGKRKGFVFTPTVPLKGEGEKEGFPQGFVEWSGFLLLVCLVMLRGKPLIVCLIGRLRQAEPLIVYKR